MNEYLIYQDNPPTYLEEDGELTREMTPGQLKLLEDMKDAKDFYANIKDKDEETKEKLQNDEKQQSSSKLKKKKTSKEKREELEEEEAEYKKELEEQFVQLWEKAKELDPYKDINIEKCDGKIQIDEENREKAGPSDSDMVPVKYRYFIKRRPQKPEEFTKYFKNFDWKAKGVVRKRFEAVQRQRYLNKGYTISDFKSRLADLKSQVKALEEVSGRQIGFRHLIEEQQVKYNFFAKPANYYKEFFLINNSHNPEQIDVRRMPPYYTHRKVSIALDNLSSSLLKEKERKFRTSLHDHMLFAIVCDGHKFNKSGIEGGKKQKRPDFQFTKDNEIDDNIKIDEDFDWN